MKLEGKLLEPWVTELARVCGEGGGGRREMRLDLAGVSFVDAAGTKLLADLLGRGAALVACSNYVAELLHRERP